MKYWKQFWGGLNQGWKRIHYVGLPTLMIVIFLLISDGRTQSSEVPGAIMTITGLAIVPYFLIITAIYWIKEGFQSKEPTEEE